MDEKTTIDGESLSQSLGDVPESRRLREQSLETLDQVNVFVNASTMDFFGNLISVDEASDNARMAYQQTKQIEEDTKLAKRRNYDIYPVRQSIAFLRTVVANRRRPRGKSHPAVTPPRLIEKPKPRRNKT